MRTIKRNIPDIDTTIGNTTKYFNQFEFKGIIEDNNIFAIDQESCRDAMNIYVSFDDRLKSRPTLQHEDIPSVFNTTVYLGYNLVEIKRFGSSYIYVFEHDNKYYVIYYDDTILEIGDDDNLAIDDLNSYHLSSIEHYIICFNNDAAKIIDTNKVEDGWYYLTNQVYIPTTQITTGANTVDAEASNDFTGQSKHQYNWSNSSQPDMSSEGNTSAEVTIITSNGKQESYELPNAALNTDYKLIKKTDCLGDFALAITGSDILSASSIGGVICVANSISFKVSFNNGMTFDTYFYPAYEGSFCNIAKVSDDGQYFFFVTTVGVYRCNLSDFTWTDVNKPFVNTTTNIDTILVNSRIELSYFKDGTTYAFITYDNSTVKFYCCVNNIFRSFENFVDGASDLQPIKNYINVTTRYRNSNYFENRFSIIYNSEQNIYAIVYIGPNATTFNNSTILTLLTTDTFTNTKPIIAGTINSNTANFIKCILNNNSSNYTFNNSNNWSINLDALIGKITSGTAGIWYRDFVNITITYTSSYSSTITVNTSNNINDNNNLMYIRNDIIPGVMKGGYVAEHISGYLFVNSYINSIWSTTTFAGTSLFAFDDSYYFLKSENGKYRLYTNKLYTNSVTNEEDVAQIVYTVGSAGSYNKVPQVSYADTELYLGFNKLLQISQNTKDENNNLLLYLPTTNNQSFIDDITGMINISTTEVALFFKNKITICSKVQDSNLPEGYRYDYYNTKLSLGIRLGDSIINTLEGSYTIFPTKRGLAIMNYQAFMATTDQVVEYMTDHIPALWALFYGNDDDGAIKIIQWRTYLVLTNGTGEMLLYNLSTNAWWRWTIPVSVMHLLTDQEKLYVISNGLYVFKDQKELTYDNELSARRYFDFSETQPNGITINWRIISQPLHFKAPTYYKNIKQIIFQFYDIDEQNIYNKTLNAQIKLYRKRITITEPETIDFKIEGLRTFVKRFNYWKINELQWAISNDDETTTPAQFEINNVSIKYEIGDEVR